MQTLNGTSDINDIKLRYKTETVASYSCLTSL